ncbi:glycosyltransferase family 1 protein [Oceanidesulfovibrio marinus]|uniref:Glycosyltransferase family 1 protein n=2 Tax=Oceanidesulfovibrio marinus TaxID=370038 RepID=A0A6P1ZGQ3_9BACT|nr:glycosyltransferase family 1 protein [Oceanidesulfovibrio marinus]
MTRDMNILIVARWPLGGIRTYIRYTYGHVSETCRITIVAPETHELQALRQDAARLGAELVTCGDGCARIAKAVHTELRRTSYSIVHSQGFISAATSYPACRLAGVPNVLTLHGILEERLLSGWKGSMKRAALSSIVRRLDGIHAVSNDILKNVENDIPGLRQDHPPRTVIENGIDTAWFAGCRLTHASLRHELGIADHEFVFGFLGRMMPQKGFDILMDAAGMLAAENRRFRILAAASGDYVRESCEKIRCRGLYDLFTIIPFQADPRRVYAAVDTLVMPSRWEAWGLVAVEALCSGTPLIASSCLGLRESLANTPAVMVPPENPQALADAMRAAMDTRRDTSARSQAFTAEACARFDSRKSTNRLLEFMNTVIANQRNASRPKRTAA